MATRHDYNPKALIKARKKVPTKTAGRGSGLTPRIKSALEAMVFGIDGEAFIANVSIEKAAEHAGITARAIRAAMLKPAVLAHFREQTQLLREGERPANLRTAIEIRDSAALKATAAGQKVRLEAAKQLDADLYENRGLTVNVGVKVDTPGYVIDLSGTPDETSTVIEHSHDQQTVTSN